MYWLIKMYIALAFAFIIYLPHEASAQQENAAAVKVTITAQQASIMQSQIDTLQKKIDALDKNQTVIQESLSSMDNNAAELNNGLSNLASQFISNRHSSVVGAILILMGLMLEIIGAVFVASEILTKKLILVRNLNRRPSMKDLGLEDTAVRDIIGFLSVLGVVIIFSGFTMQAVGTLMILNLSVLWWLGVAISMIATAIIAICFVAGRSQEQAASEKTAILARCVYYTFAKPLIFKFWFGELCDYCREPIRRNNIYVAFNSKENTKDHPYLHTPHRYLLGHMNCLLKVQDEELEKLNTAKQKEDVKATQKLLGLNEFISWSNEMIPWHQQWRKHWTVSRQNDLGERPWFTDLIIMRKRLGIHSTDRDKLR